MPPPAPVFEMLRALGVNYPTDLQTIEHMPFEDGEKALEALKERVRKNYRRLAFELHPDRNGNDPEKAEQFKLATEVRERVEKMTLRRAPPPMPTSPPPTIFVVRQAVFPQRQVQAVHIHRRGAPPGGVSFFVARMKPT